MNAAAEWIACEVTELVAEHAVVGVQVALLTNGAIHDTAAGVLDNVTNEPVTTESVFQIGSITKVLTATLVQELVNERLLDLDRPVRDVLTDFRLADERAAKSITPRQLLCHLAGFDGDQLFDTGAGDDRVARYVDLLRDATQVCQPGELYSYCNSGYVVLGRIVELLRGRPFSTVLRERLIVPLGLSHVAIGQAEHHEHRVATGHLASAGVLKPVERPMPESRVPAGSALAMSARDLLMFVQMHLQTTAFDAMRKHQSTYPDYGAGESWWGLGWALGNHQGGTVIGHTGLSAGYQATLRVVPEAGVAVAMLTNGGENVRAAHSKVFAHLLARLADVHPPDAAIPPAEPVEVDAKRLAGTYRCSACDIRVTPTAEGHFRVRIEASNWAFRALFGDSERQYTALSENALIALDTPHAVLPMFGCDDHGRVRWLHWGGRAMQRV